jgi:MFS family permease
MTHPCGQPPTVAAPTLKTQRAAVRRNPERLVTTAFLILCGSQFAFFSSDRMLWVVLPLHLQDLGFDYAAIGMVLGAFTVSSTLCRPLVGRAVDRWGERWFLLGGAVVFILGALGYAFTTTFSGFLALRLFHGLGPALFVTACYTRVSRLSPPHRLGEALTYITLANNVAMAAGPAGGVYMARAVGFSSLCLAAAGIAVCALLAGLWPMSSPLATAATRETPPGGASVSMRVSLQRIAVPVVVIFLALMSFGSVMSFFPLLAAAHGVDNPGVFFTVMAVTLILTRVCGGRIADVYSRARIIMPSLALMAAGMFVLAVATSPLFFILASVLCASGVSLLVPTLMAATVEQTGAARRGWAIGLFTATMDLSMAVGTVGSGVLLHLTEAYPLVFGASGGCVLLSLLVFASQAKGDVWRGAKAAPSGVSSAAREATQPGEVETTM